MRRGMAVGTRLLLWAVLAVSLGLRVWGSGFGLPAYTRYHPDEHALVDRAAQILWTGDWNLHVFNYPPFYAYVQAVTYASRFLWGAARGEWVQVPPYALPQYYHVGRLVTALCGTLTILVVYLSGRQMSGHRLGLPGVQAQGSGTPQRTGLLAAALLGGCYLHVIHSHYATFDVMVGLLASLTLLFSDLLRTRRQARWYFLAGLCAGLAGATKYNGAVALMIPLVGHFLAASEGERGWFSGHLALVGGGFLLGFFGGNPFALGNLPDFLNGLALVLHHYGTRQPGFEGTGNWRWYPRAFLTSADALWAVVGTLGLGGLTWQQWRKGLLLISFPVFYYLLVSSFVVRFERNMVPLLPFLAIGGGWLLHEVTDWLAHRLRGRARWSNGLATFAAILVLLPSLAASATFDAILSRTDYREAAGRWVEENVEPGSRIAIEHYAIPFDYDLYHVEDVIRISDHDLSWYQQEGYDLLIISDGVWEVLRRQPVVYADKLTVYDELVTHSSLLAQFTPRPPGIVVAGYPTVAVYHFAPVRIYKVPH